MLHAFGGGKIEKRQPWSWENDGTCFSNATKKRDETSPGEIWAKRKALQFSAEDEI